METIILTYQALLNDIFLYVFVNKIYLISIVFFLASFFVKFPAPFESWKTHTWAYLTYSGLICFWTGLLFFIAPKTIDHHQLAPLQGLIVLLFTFFAVWIKLSLAVPSERENEHMFVGEVKDGGVSFEQLFDAKKLREWQEINKMRIENGLSPINFRHVLLKKRSEKETILK